MFLILGLVVHPFFFGILMLDFIRTKLLKNVVRAVWYPRDILLQSFAFFLILVYFFAVVIYIAFPGQMVNNYDSELWLCFLKTFDFMFKDGGGVGTFLVDSNRPAVMQPHIDSNGHLVVTTNHRTLKLRPLNEGGGMHQS